MKVAPALDFRTATNKDGPVTREEYISNGKQQK